MKFKRTILLAGFVILMVAGCAKYAAETKVSTSYIIPLVKKIQPAVVTIVAYDVNRNVTNLGAYGGLGKSRQEMEALKQAIRILPRYIIIWGLSTSRMAIRQRPLKNIKF